MMDKWSKLSKVILKTELVKRSLTIDDLVAMLNTQGCKETRSSVNSKISRGTFNAAFFLKSLDVIGCHNVNIKDYIDNILENNEENN